MDSVHPSHPLEAFPSWLAPANAGALAAKLRRENQRALYETIFEPVLARMVECRCSFSAAVKDDPRGFNPTDVLAWVHQDEERKARYYAAQALTAEAVADEMIEIADAPDTAEDVNRSTLRINTRKWLLGVWNRKRFGDVKQIEQNVTIDMGQAMIEAQERAARVRALPASDVVDVEAKS